MENQEKTRKMKGFDREIAEESYRNMQISLSLLSSKDITILGSVIIYLKDQKKLNYHEIGITINRDERNIRTLYLLARERQLEAEEEKIETEISIPISIFAAEKISALESITVYLHDKLELRFSEIAGLLQRDQRTIWTVYHRARKKTVE